MKGDRREDGGRQKGGSRKARRSKITEGEQFGEEFPEDTVNFHFGGEIMTLLLTMVYLSIVMALMMIMMILLTTLIQ